MHPEHKLLKFVILPMVLILLAYLAWDWIETPGRWSSLYSYNNRIYFNGKYDGSTELTGENLGKYIATTYEDEKLKGAVAACDGKKSVWFCSSDDTKIKLTEQSKFRVASISKVFTSLAVLQLADSGKLSLDDKVDKFIDYERHFQNSPTVRDLLLHTAGFDNNNSSFFYKTRDEKPKLEDFVYRKPIVQAIEPHKVFDYTNIAFDMAGLIVQKVSGQRFEDYCSQNFFKPLEMTGTSFDEPDHYETGMDNRGETVENYFVGGTPSGGLITTAKDMGNFMLCLINEGKYRDKTVISPKVIDMAFTSGMDLGSKLNMYRTPVFWINNYDKFSTFEQAGKILGYSSDLIIERGKAAAFSVCAGDDAGQTLAGSIFGNFFVPKSKDADSGIHQQENKIEAKPIVNPDDYTGTWINMFGWNRNNAAKIANAAFFNLDVTVEGNDLNINYTTVQNIDGENFGNNYWNVKFIRDDKGQIKYLQTGQDAHVKAPWYMSTKFLTIYGVLTLFFFLLFCLQWLFGMLLRMFAKEKSSKPDKLLRSGIALASIINLIFFAILFITMSTTDIYRVGFKPEFSWYVVFTLPIISVVLTIPIIIGVVYLWVKKLWTIQARMNALLFVVVQCLFIWSLIFWNLLGYNF